MSACTFFGHRDCPEEVRGQVQRVVEDLILHHGVDSFYVGHQGRFDAIVRGVLRQLEQEYPQICYGVVLVDVPKGWEDTSDTMLPEGIEAIHPRYAIDWRNNWMLKRSDFVVTYITHSWGGAAKFAQKARKDGKTVIDLPQGKPYYLLDGRDSVSKN